MQRNISHTSGRCLSRLVGLSVFLTLSTTGLASAAPLSKSSPLYNPGATIVDENPDVVADYKGTITEVYESPELPGTGQTGYRKATLEWDESIAGPVDQIEYTSFYGASSLHWHVNRLSGAVDDRRTEPGASHSCHGTFSARTTDGGTGGIFVPLETPGHPATGGNPATNPDYSVARRAPFELVASAASGDLQYCEADPWWDSSGNTAWGNPVAFASQEPTVGAEWGDTVAPTVYFPPGGGHTQALDFSYTCAPPKCSTESQYNSQTGTTTKAGTVTVTVQSSITFSSPGLGGGRGPTKRKTTPSGGGKAPEGPVSCSAGSKPTCPEKKAAQEDLRSQIVPAAAECGIVVLGVGGLVAGAAAPEIGVGVILSAAGPIGAEIFALSAPVCASMIKRIYDDAKIVNDPPLGNIHQLARPASPKRPAASLPSCVTAPPEAKPACEAVRAAALRYADCGP